MRYREDTANKRSVSVRAKASAVPAVFYASQSGQSTLDQGEGGGNPFASALVELLRRRSLTYAELRSDLIDLTTQKSQGFQVPDAAGGRNSTEWRLKPLAASAKRVALVFVYSNYREAGQKSLPGAKRDLSRVAVALRKAGFEVTTAPNPSRKDLRTALQTLSAQSQDAEAAAVYVTGHGFEHRGHVYLLPSDYPFHDGPSKLSKLAVHVASLAKYLKAYSANMVFYGGCRTYWRK